MNVIAVRKSSFRLGYAGDRRSTMFINVCERFSTFRNAVSTFSKASPAFSDTLPVHYGRFTLKVNTPEFDVRQRSSTFANVEQRLRTNSTLSNALSAFSNALPMVGHKLLAQLERFFP